MSLASRAQTWLGALALGLIMIASPALAIPAHVAPEGVCTRDINACGQASICMCGPGYEYNSSVGRCVATDLDVVTSGGDRLADSRCATSPQGVCTMDINAAGHASACMCDGYAAYNSTLGKCVTAP